MDCSTTDTWQQLSNELICVEYPGAVCNTDRMIETLGGNREISTTFSNDKRRLGLRFRPDCIFAKPVYGDVHSTTGIVLKVKYRRKRSTPNKMDVSGLELMGSVYRAYKFDTLCDFQHLPAQRNSKGVVECVYDEVVPRGVVTDDLFSGSSEVPFFLPPSSFSRSDIINLSVIRDKDTVGMDDSTYIKRKRVRRAKHGIYQLFSLTEPLPVKPKELSEEMLRTKMVPPSIVEAIRNAFEDRPIWTKNALRNQVNASNSITGLILPTVAFYYVNGPWRGTWVRFGYDPRKYFDARYYQLLDFRVRSVGTVHDRVKRKQVPYLSKPNLRGERNRNDDEPEKIPCSTFSESTIPQMRIMFYQFCDIHLAQIQEMLEKLPSPIDGTVCDEKCGWLPPRLDENCRSIMMDIVSKNCRELKDSDPDAYGAMESMTDADETTYEEEDEELPSESPWEEDEVDD